MKIISEINVRNFIIFLFFPLTVVGTAVLNLYLVFLSFFLIFQFFKKKFFFDIKKNLWFKLYIIFFSFVLINSFFALNAFDSLRSSISQIRFFLFSLFIMFFLDYKSLPKFLKYLSYFNLLICFDTIYQYKFGVDIFGLGADQINNPYRLSGPFGEELIVGAYLYLSSIMIFAYFLISQNNQNFGNFYRWLYVLIVIFTIILSGERMNSILVVVTTLILLFFKFKKIKFKFYSALLFLLLLVFFYNINKTAEIRTKSIFHELNFLHENMHVRLYSSAIEMWLDNPIKGVGSKNFRVVCDKTKINNYTGNYNICSTHPHNFYLELLSENGILGLLLFLAFISSLFILFFKKIIFFYNPIFLGCFLIVVSYLFPFRSSGSFFSSWYGSFFWFHLGILLNSLRKEKII
jgi:O-antigen ligase